MCNCIENIEKSLESESTYIAKTTLIEADTGARLAPRIYIQKFWIDPEGQGKPKEELRKLYNLPKLRATYCPFCGELLPTYSLEGAANV